MGNEQSNNITSTSSASTATGLPSSLSFLSRTAPRAPAPIVVINTANPVPADPNEDEQLKHIREIPRFLPIIRDVLPAYAPNPSDVRNKIESRLVHRLFHRLQTHFTACSEVVATEQKRIFSQVTQLDQLLSATLKKATLQNKRFEQLAVDIQRVELLEEQLSDQINGIRVAFFEINEQLETFNKQISTTPDRIRPLTIFPLDNLSQIDKLNEANRIESAIEFRVVDKK